MKCADVHETLSLFSIKNVYGIINIYIFAELYIFFNKDSEFLIHKAEAFETTCDWLESSVELVRLSGAYEVMVTYSKGEIVYS